MKEIITLLQLRQTDDDGNNDGTYCNDDGNLEKKRNCLEPQSTLFFVHEGGRERVEEEEDIIFLIQGV